MAKRKPTEVTPPKKGPTALAQFNYDDHQGAGFENQGRDDQMLQPLKLLQAQSPEVVDDEPTGAKAGLLLEPATMTLHKEITFIPVYREHVYTEWKPRDSGGGGGAGWVGEHAPDSETVTKAKAAAGRAFGLIKSEAGNDLSETFKLYALLIIGDQFLMSLVMFDSSKIKVWKKASQRLRAFQIRKPDGGIQMPPMYAHLAKLSTSKETNAKGTWFNFTWNPANTDVKDSVLSPEDPRFQAAAEYYKLITAGKVKVDMTAAAPEADGDDPKLPY